MNENKRSFIKLISFLCICPLLMKNSIQVHKSNYFPNKSIKTKYNSKIWILDINDN